ncbi:hypothetical protein ElyMa_004042800 [Elysia marginata]|uniref:Uncharacterized protein n=1 Tax=Elysia marginata TaxID=1093978 RepID=A0AAV4G520_9GAST|nr:hypothetical protein ElyMa_004042800 [Elysia marginata]
MQDNLTRPVRETGHAENRRRSNLGQRSKLGQRSNHDNSPAKCVLGYGALCVLTSEVTRQVRRPGVNTTRLTTSSYS